MRWLLVSTLVGLAACAGPSRMVRPADFPRSEEHTSELQSRSDLVCRLLLEKKKVDRVVAVEDRVPPECRDEGHREVHADLLPDARRAVARVVVARRLAAAAPMELLKLPHAH